MEESSINVWKKVGKCMEESSINENISKLGNIWVHLISMGGVLLKIHN